MAKVIHPYPLCHATSIINRSADIGDEVENGDGDVEVTNITTSKIRNGMAGDSNAVYDLHSHEHVNQWSHFGPYEHVAVSYVITPQLKSPAAMGDFAGYDHNAVEPYIELSQGTQTDKEYWKGEESCATEPSIQIHMHLAEIDFKGMAKSGKLYAEMINQSDTDKKLTFTIDDYEADSTFQTMTTQRDVNAEHGFVGDLDAVTYKIRLKSLTDTDVLYAYVGDELSVTVSETILSPAICDLPMSCHPDYDGGQHNMLLLATNDSSKDVYYFRRNCTTDTDPQFNMQWIELRVTDYTGQPIQGYTGTVVYKVVWYPNDAENESEKVEEQVLSHEFISQDNGVYTWSTMQHFYTSNINLDTRNVVYTYWTIP